MGLKIEGKPFEFCPDNCHMKDIEIKKIYANELVFANIVRCENEEICKMWHKRMQSYLGAGGDVKIDINELKRKDIKVLYLCDRKACDDCNGNCSCNHTANIRHAKNFISVKDGFMEKENSDDNMHKLIIAAYLNSCISNWRKKKKVAECDEDELIAACYIDAYQCARASLLGKELESEEK